MFRQWLSAQKTRKDRIGDFARYMETSPLVRSNRLWFYLKYCASPDDTEMREIIKDAHRQWRAETAAQRWSERRIPIIKILGMQK